MAAQNTTPTHNMTVCEHGHQQQATATRHDVAEHEIQPFEADR